MKLAVPQFLKSKPKPVKAVKPKLPGKVVALPPTPLPAPHVNGEPKLENDRPTTLLTDFEDIGLTFLPTVAGEERRSINEGVQKINDALDYDEQAPVDYVNRPKLYVASDCLNTIFALSTWTGMTEEGKTNMTGATKDPVDILRYYFLAGCDYIGKGDMDAVGGGHYA